MPCGGIYAVVEHFSRALLEQDRANPHYTCLQCDRAIEVTEDLFVEEFDAFLHRGCLGEFLCEPAGQLVLAHGHAIVVPELTNVHRCGKRRREDREHFQFVKGDGS